MAEQFQFDTSGVVRGRNDGRLSQAVGGLMPDSPISWDRLSPGVRGCIAAMLEEFRAQALLGLKYEPMACQDGGWTISWLDDGKRVSGSLVWYCSVEGDAGRAMAQAKCDQANRIAIGFSDLHPDTLARIIADWKLAIEDRRLAYHPTATAGRLFWSERQRGFLNGDIPRFPPVTPYLSDEGKVCLRDAPSSVRGG